MALTKYSEKVTAGNPMIKCEDMKHDRFPDESSTLYA